MGGRFVTQELSIKLNRHGELDLVVGAIGYEMGHPYELMLLIDGLPEQVFDVSLAVLGSYCPAENPAGGGKVRVYRHSEERVTVSILDDAGETVEAHLDADVFIAFVDNILELYTDPPLVTDEELADVISGWAAEDAGGDGAE